MMMMMVIMMMMMMKVGVICLMTTADFSYFQATCATTYFDGFVRSELTSLLLRCNALATGWRSVVQHAMAIPACSELAVCRV